MMDDKNNEYDLFLSKEWTPQIKTFLNETRSQLKGSERILFMARVVFNLGYGGSLFAQRELGWDRGSCYNPQRFSRTKIRYHML